MTKGVGLFAINCLHGLSASILPFCPAGSEILLLLPLNFNLFGNSALSPNR